MDFNPLRAIFPRRTDDDPSGPLTPRPANGKQTDRYTDDEVSLAIIAAGRAANSNIPVPGDPAFEASVRKTGMNLLKSSPSTRARTNLMYWLEVFKTPPWKWPRFFLYDEIDRVNTRLGDEPELLWRAMRFTDVLPEIEGDDALVAGHFREWFPETHSGLPFYLNTAIRYAHGKASLPLRLAALLLPGKTRNRKIAWGARMAVHQMARRYIAGENIRMAKKRIERMINSGRGVIIDVLGERIASDLEADHYRNEYLAIIDHLANDSDLLQQTRREKARQKSRASLPSFDAVHDYDYQISLKLSGLIPMTQWRPENDDVARIIKARLRPILDRMLKAEKEKSVRFQLTIDAEEHECRGLATRVLKEILMEDAYIAMENVGIVVQCYSRDTLDYLADLRDRAAERLAAAKERGHNTFGISGQTIPIRLVKGAYWDYEDMRSQKHGYPLPVLDEKWMSDVSFERAVDFALDNAHFLRTAVGSHNVRSLAYAATQSRLRGIPIEVQMLYGMFPDLESELISAGITPQMYTPLGKLLPGMAYFARRILENASQKSFLLQRLKGANPEQLLRNPAEDRDVSAWPPASQRHLPPRVMTNLHDPFVNEPLTDFSDPENRTAVRDAIARVRAQLNEKMAGAVNGISHPATVNGSTLTFSGKQPIASINPGNPDEILGRVPSMDAESAGLAAYHAHEALEQWTGKSAEERATVLMEVARQMRVKRADLTALIMLEAGKPLAEADADVAEAIDFLEYYARRAVIDREEHPELEFAPKGVAAVIAPWNFPLAILTGMTSAALVEGNTVVVKPAEQTPLIAARMVELFMSAGANRGVINFLPGDRDTGESLRIAPEVKLVVFTGSRRAGLAIYEHDVPKGTKVIAEMGGKNAMIIDRDAHPDEVISTVLYGKFGFAGQKCSAIDRLIIIGDAEDFRLMLKRLIEAARSLAVESVENFGNYFGPVIDQTALARLRNLIREAATRDGNTIHLDGRNLHSADKGYFLGPTIIEVTDPKDPLFQEENFGPVLGVMRADSVQQAIAIAEDSAYALTGGILTRSPANQEEAIWKWKGVGNLYVNRGPTGAVVGRQPFGGFKLSGVGAKAGGEDYLWQFRNVSTKAKDVAPDYKEVFWRVFEATLRHMQERVDYQPDLRGETNYVRYLPRGRGLIYTEESGENFERTMAEITALIATAAGCGNEVLLLLPARFIQPVNQFVSEVRQRDHRLTNIAVLQKPQSVTETYKLLKKHDIRWMAYTGGTSRNPVLDGHVARTANGRNFVRPIIATDPLSGDPEIFNQMVLGQTVTENTARHGFDAKLAGKQKRPTTRAMRSLRRSARPPRQQASALARFAQRFARLSPLRASGLMRFTRL